MPESPEELLPKEPNFLRDIDLDAIPFVYVELLLGLSSQMKALNLHLSHIAAVLEAGAPVPMKDLTGRISQFSEAWGDAAIEEYQRQLLSLAKRYCREAMKPAARIRTKR